MSFDTPLYLQSKVYPASKDRRLMSSTFGPGVLQEMAVTVPGGVRTVSCTGGSALVPSPGWPATDGVYFVNSTSTITDIEIDDAVTYPRVDQIVLRVYDSQYAGVLNEAVVEVVKGVEASGATLVNRTGAVADNLLPGGSLRLADVLAPVGSGAITTIRDRRVFCPFNSPNGEVPISGFLLFGGTTPPTYGVWKQANGTTIDRMTYAAYFAAVGHKYNGGVDPGGVGVLLPTRTDATDTWYVRVA